MASTRHSAAPAAAIRGSRRGPLVTLVAVLSLLAASLPVSQAADANLGCYRVDKSNPVRKRTLRACRNYCMERKYPIYSYDWTRGCGCTAVFPRKSRRIAASVCLSRGRNASTWFYVNNGGGKCSISPRNLRPQDWTVDIHPEFVEWVAPSSLKLTVKGIEGPRLQLKGAPQKYGYFTVKLRMAGPEQGPVTALYWTSDPTNENRENFDEIDLEFINWLQKEPTPGCLWLCHWKNGQNINETIMCPPEIQKVAALKAPPNTYKDSQLYGIDWQPTYIRWYFQNRLIYERVYADGAKVPEKPMNLKLSLWQRNDGYHCNFWGGCSEASATADFRDFSAVTCSD